MMNTGRSLALVLCAAGPASHARQLIVEAQQRGWKVSVITTPAALDFIDVPALEILTGNPVRSRHRKPGEPQGPRMDAIIVAPATYNTINKWANGSSDTYALTLLAEAVNLDIPIVVVPFVNTALAARRPFQRAIDDLRAEGVHIIYGPGQWEPHPPGSGSWYLKSFPWMAALDRVEQLTGTADAPR